MTDTAVAPQTITNDFAAHATDAMKVYGANDTAVYALNGVTVGFERGRFSAIMGPSGSGKSTLMQCMAGLDRLTSGVVTIGGVSLDGLSDRKLTELRRDKVGFIFQSFNLVPTLNAEENILLPLHLGGHKVDREWFNRVIEAVGLQSRLTHRPSELSGGQAQRVACARALVSKPDIVFADEPTGNLDSTSSTEILSFMKQSVREFGQTIVMVTHDPKAASFAERVVFLADGKIVSELREPTADAVLDMMKSIGR
jgi:putative ABC transport system ATP-binding protein